LPRRKTPDSDSTTVLLNLYSHRKLWNLSEGRDEDLARRFPSVRFELTADRSVLKERLPHADVLFSWHLPADLFHLAKKLRWIHTPAAGIDHLLYPAMRGSDIALTNCRGLSGDVMAEHLLALMLAFSRRLHEAVRMQHSQRWGQDHMWSTSPIPFRLAGRTVGIVGLGGIGTELARRAKALGMQVLSMRRTPAPKPRFVDELLGADGLDDLLERSDFVVLCVPLTQETRGMIGARELSKMKKSAYLLNVGRGEHINETALVRALRAGSIAGAALDVFQNEPLPRRSIFWRVPNLIVSPHYAGTYPEHMDRATDLFAENLRLYLAGRKLKNLVDKKTGY
jgi:phosphoglycerate dehydrogenase-like enzyme